MPYISQSQRESNATAGRNGQQPYMANPGELNYELTLKIKVYLEDHGLSYHTLNDIIGALEGAKMEFYRRVVAPYEDTKIKMNGDVY